MGFSQFPSGFAAAAGSSGSSVLVNIYLISSAVALMGVLVKLCEQICCILVSQKRNVVFDTKANKVYLADNSKPIVHDGKGNLVQTLDIECPSSCVIAVKTGEIIFV